MVIAVPVTQDTRSEKMVIPVKVNRKDLRIMSDYVGTDVDECENASLCDQLCLNTPGNYSCSCKSGYVLRPDGKTCLGELTHQTRS